MTTVSEIIRTQSARCRDCYRCVRACPVNAIGIKSNQAFVNQDMCIVCGTCVKECPQYAKVYRNDIERAAELVKTQQVVASIAPSFAGVYGGMKTKVFPAAVRKLGFAAVAETAEGAALTASYAGTLSAAGSDGIICSACPAVVNYIEKYAPDRTDRLMDIVSPMVAHARLIKSLYGNETKVVFIGPCIAKKQEAERPEYAGEIDVVLTFSELDQWLEREQISLEQCEEEGFDHLIDSGEASYFPLPGGMIKTMGIMNDGSQQQIMHTCGGSNVRALLDASAEILGNLRIIEPLFCNEGCLNGPGIASADNLFQRRTNLIAYNTTKRTPDKSSADQTAHKLPVINLKAGYQSKGVEAEEVSEEQILEIFRKTGKSDPEARLDCGACGYASCTEKAKAVIRGMAEKEMCVPFMRRLAEQRTDKIIATNPNGIVILDDSLCILSMNQAFCDFFSCSDGIIGKKISYLIDAKPFEELVTGTTDYSEKMTTCYGKEFHQIVYKLPAENQFVGIFVDMSGIRVTEAKLDTLKKETIEKAQELLDHQIKMAQTLAKYLGESTAHSEDLVERLMKVHE